MNKILCISSLTLLINLAIGQTDASQTPRRRAPAIPISSENQSQDGRNKVQVIEKENFDKRVYILKLKPLNVSATKTYPQWQDIDGEEINIEMEKEGPVLIQFNATDTWNNGGTGTWYAIEVDGVIKAQISVSGFNDQRIPVLLSTIEKLSVGTHTLKTKWCTQSGGTSGMGSWSQYQFMAVKL
jgi:hypothetical protein